MICSHPRHGALLQTIFGSVHWVAGRSATLKWFLGEICIYHLPHQIINWFPGRPLFLRLCLIAVHIKVKHLPPDVGVPATCLPGCQHGVYCLHSQLGSSVNTSSPTEDAADHPGCEQGKGAGAAPAWQSLGWDLPTRWRMLWALDAWVPLPLPL